MLRQVANQVVKWLVSVQRRFTTFARLVVAYRCGTNPIIKKSNSITHSWMSLDIAKPVRIKSAEETFPFLAHSMQFTSPMNPFPRIPKMSSPVATTIKETLIPNDIFIKIFLTLSLADSFVVKQLQMDIHVWCFL